MTSRIYAIVGGHFRPPAKGILAALPSGHPLVLRPEPSNPFDSDAIAVWVTTDTLDHGLHTLLNTLCTGFGYPLEALLEQPEWHLGYVPKIETVNMRVDMGKLYDFTDATYSTFDYSAEMRFNAKGAPAVVCVAAPEAARADDSSFQHDMDD